MARETRGLLEEKKNSVDSKEREACAVEKTHHLLYSRTRGPSCTFTQPMKSIFLRHSELKRSVGITEAIHHLRNEKTLERRLKFLTWSRKI